MNTDPKINAYRDRTREELLADIIALRSELDSLKRNTTLLPANGALHRLERTPARTVARAAREEKVSGWTIPPSPLVGIEVEPGVFALPTRDIYPKPELDKPPAISEALQRAAHERDQPQE